MKLYKYASGLDYKNVKKCDFESGIISFESRYQHIARLHREKVAPYWAACDEYERIHGKYDVCT